MNEKTRTLGVTLDEYRNDKFEKRLEEQSTLDQSLWKMAKALRKTDNKIGPIVINKQKIWKPEEMAELFADTYYKQFTPHQETEIEFNNQAMKKYIEIVMTTSTNTTKHPTSPEEIKSHIKMLNKKKAPGPDNINNQILKNLPHKAIMSLTNIINAILRHKYFPNK